MVDTGHALERRGSSIGGALLLEILRYIDYYFLLIIHIKDFIRLVGTQGSDKDVDF